MVLKQPFSYFDSFIAYFDIISFAHRSFPSRTTFGSSRWSRSIYVSTTYADDTSTYLTTDYNIATTASNGD